MAKPVNQRPLELQIYVNGEDHIAVICDKQTREEVGVLGEANHIRDCLNATKIGLSFAEVAALIDEMQAKWYSQMKARGLKVLEGVLHRKELAKEPEGALLVDALDDALRATLDVLQRRAPEITPELIAQATADRQTADRDEKARLEAKRDTERIEREGVDVDRAIQQARDELASLERRRQRLQTNTEAIAVRQQIHALSSRLATMC